MIYSMPMPSNAETVGIVSFAFYGMLLFNAQAFINNGKVL
jgi:hypothetical protein